MQATRDDYVQAAAQAAQAGHIAANATPGLSLADATQASGIIKANPDFTGTAQQLANLTELAANMGKAFDETAVKAANDLAAAMENPGQAADKLVGHLKGMTQATADTITNLEAAGDKAGAFADYAGVVGAAVTGAAGKLSPLNQALRDIKTAFQDSGSAGQQAGEGIGGAFDHALTKIVESVAGALDALKGLHDWDAQYLPWAQQSSGTGAPGTAATVNSGQFADHALYGDVATIAGDVGLTAPQLAFARTVTQVESGGNQYNAQGGVLTSSAGALGAMQVLPSTAAAYGEDPTTVSGNLSAGEQLIKHLWDKYHGDQTLVAAAYNWGEGNLDAWIAKGSNPQALPAETANYVNKVVPGNALVPAGSAVGTGVSDTPQSVINQALKAADGSVEGQGQKLTAQITLIKQALADLSDQGVDPNSASWSKLQNQLQADQLALSNLEAPFEKAGKALSDQTDAQNRLTAAYGEGHDAVIQATAANAGTAQAMQVVGEKSFYYADAISELTQKHLALAQATAATAIAQQTLSNGDQLDYLKAETSSLGDNTDARNAMLADLKAEQDLRQKGVSDLSNEGQAYLASVDAISAQSAALAKNQQVMGDLENAATSAFDSVGSAITQAFANGSKSALDFGAIARTVLSQITDQVLKLAVLNPVLNSLFGGNRTTFSDASGYLGQLINGGAAPGSGAASGGFTLPGGYTQIGSESIGGGLPDGYTQISGEDIQSGLYTQTPVSSIAGGAGGGGLFGAGGIGQALGLTGPNGLLSTPLSSLGLGSGTVGSALGGAGLGFGAGTLLNGLVGGNSANGEIGSGVGAAAGAAIGSIIPGVGTIIGGLLGGVAGGLLGGLIGPPPTDATEYTKIDLTTGKSQALGNTPGSSKYSAANAAAANGLADLVYGGETAITSAFNLQPLNTNIEAKVGNRDGSVVRFDNGTQFTSSGSSTAQQAVIGNEGVSYLIGKIGSSLDSTTQAILKEIDYSKGTAAQQVAALAQAVGSSGKLDADQVKALPNINLGNVDSATSDLNWIKNTYEPTINNAADAGSIATQTTALNTQFAQLISQAQRLGLSIDGLTTAQTTALQQITDATNQTIAASGATILSGSQKQNGDSLGAQLTAFDQSGNTNEQQLTAEFKGLFGDAYTSNADYVKQMGQLTATIAAQRADLITSYVQQTEATVGASRASILAASQKENGDAIGSQLTAFDQAGSTSEQQLTTEFQGLFGDAYTSNADYVSQMGQLTATIADQRADLIRTYQAQQIAQDLQASQTNISNITAGWKAQASIAESSSYLPTVQWGQQLDEGADLANFDASAQVQTNAYSQQLLTTYGQGFASSQAYANDMVNLENSLAEQRLAIQSQYAQQAKAQENSAAQSASGVITGLTSFVQGLQQGSASPLSAKAQYDLAKGQYDTDAQQAEGGNVTALGQVQNYAQAFLAASQNLYGSGTQYTADFGNVLTALQSIANIPQTTLTQDFMSQVLQDQTSALTVVIQSLQSTVASISLELKQQNARAPV